MRFALKSGIKEAVAAWDLDSICRVLSLLLAG
jgi:hypothetical protein